MLYYVVTIIFHRQAWYRALSLRYSCIRSSGIIVIPYATVLPNFVSFAASNAELAHGEEIAHSITRPASLMPRTEALALRNRPIFTSNVTSRHRSPKRKRSWRALESVITTLHYVTVLSMGQSPMLRTIYFLSSSVVSHAVSALCVYSKFGHHPHPLGDPCAKFRFCRGPHCSAGPWSASELNIFS